MSVAEIVRHAVEAAVNAEVWAEPEALTASLDPQPYPIDALPELIRAAVMEVQSFVKAPIALVASSALSAVATAAQAHVDVRRADSLKGPSSLFMLAIAESGERKSSCDAYFVQAIREWEKAEAIRLEPEMQAYRAAMATWEAKREGLLLAIKGCAKDGRSSVPAEVDLAAMERCKPVAPRIPQILKTDNTPEALAWFLAKQWPVAAVLSSEAGLVLGAHGMGRETIVRNLALLNLLWDGGDLRVERRSSESFAVRGARLTMGLQVQEAALRAFYKGSKGLARGTGFFARFLFSWPPSTQGTRSFAEPPVGWPALSKFNDRITALLDRPVLLQDDGTLAPAVLDLSDDARATWVACHDGIEEELRGGGELADVRDVASKAADNAARLAALFHVLEHGPAGLIGLDHMVSAARIAGWHLSESRRFFAEIAMPAPVADAIRVERFAVDWCRRNAASAIPRRELQNSGPVRDGNRLEVALVELEGANRVRQAFEARRKLVVLHPSLIGGEKP